MLKVICRIGIFVICAQTLVHFRPKETYEKYLKLFVSAIIILQLMLPLGRLLFGENMNLVADRLEDMKGDLAREMDYAAALSGEADKILERITLKELQQKIMEEKKEEEKKEMWD